MTRLRVALICCTILSGGCVDTSVVLHVWPDGHGRAVMTTRVYEAGLHAFDGLFPAQSPPRSLEEELPPPDEGTVLEFFGGRRLKLASSQFHKTNDGAVRTTIAEFSDVTELKVPFPPTFGLGATSHISIGGVVDEPRMSFALRPHENGDRLLVVKLPDGRVDADPDLQMTVFKTDSPEERAIKTAIKKMAVHFKVQLEDAPLLRTNAPASSGNSVTVLDLDLDKIINNLNENKVRQAISPASMQEILWQLGDMPGAVLPTEHEVFLEFEVPRQQAPAQPPAQAQGVASPPDTEIYLAPLKVSGAAIEVGEAINITNSPGYDNQPSFTPDGRAILFTSVRGPSPGVPGGSHTQTDIYRYEIAARQT